VVGGIGGRSLKPAGRVSPATASIPPPSFVHRRPISRCIEYIANSCVECPALRNQHTLAVWAPALQPQTSGRLMAAIMAAMAERAASSRGHQGRTGLLRWLGLV
jgi:hypothetical protein